MPTPIIPDAAAARLSTFVDADPVGLVCVGVIGGFLLFVALAGLTMLVRDTRPAPAHRPGAGRKRPTVPERRTRREPQHRGVDVTQQLTAHPYPAYLGPPDDVASARPPALATGGAR